jgi:hypothetical protein
MARHSRFAGDRMTERKPTRRERRRWAEHWGNRPVNDWGSGDLPAPWAEGDLAHWSGDPPNDRLRGMEPGYFVVHYATSIDEGDAWYFRVANGSEYRGSDRLHVVYAARSTWDEDIDWMAGFELVDTSDPEGLAKREAMLRDGWTFQPPRTCPTCGSYLPPDSE